MDNSKKMTWYSLAFIAFSGVWGFGNVANGFMYFNGTKVIFSWVLMFALYFVPYALMVGELDLICIIIRSFGKTDHVAACLFISSSKGHDDFCSNFKYPLKL